MVKNPPTMQETWVWSPGWEDPWRREQQPTPVFLPGEFHGERSLEGYSPRDHKESDMAEWLSLSLQVVQWWRIHLPVQEAQETWIRSLGQENPLKEGMATHSNILTWRIPWTEESGRLWGCKELDVTEYTHIDSYLLFHSVQIDFQVFLKLWLFDHSLVTWVESALESFVFQIRKKKKLKKLWGLDQQRLRNTGLRFGSWKKDTIDSLVAQTVKRLPAMREIRVRSLG